MIRSKEGAGFYLIYSFQSCARYLLSCKQLLQPAWTSIKSITLGKPRHQRTLILQTGKNPNGNWYLWRKCTTGLLQKLPPSFSRYSWPWTKPCTYTHPYSKQNTRTSSTCSFCYSVYLKKATFGMNNDCHPCIAGKMTDFLLPKLQWSLFTPTRCNVVHGQSETPIQQKKDHLQKEGFIAYSTCLWMLSKTGKFCAEITPRLVFESFFTITMAEVFKDSVNLSFL